MQKRQNSVAGLAPLGTSEPSKQIEHRATATVLALVRKEPAAPASKKPPIRLSSVGGPEQRSGHAPLTETFVGSVQTARARARQVINEVAPAGYIRIVEGWQQLADGQVQFTVRRLAR